MKHQPTKKIRTFEDLQVWQHGIELAKLTYRVCNQGELARDFGLRDQLRRASVSVSANVAEGFERRTKKEYIHFLSIAKGSVGEVRSLLRVALEVNYIDSTTHEELKELALKISRMLGNQIRVIAQSIKRA